MKWNEMNKLIWWNEMKSINLWMTMEWNQSTPPPFSSQSTPSIAEIKRAIDWELKRRSGMDWFAFLSFSFVFCEARARSKKNNKKKKWKEGGTPRVWFSSLFVGYERRAPLLHSFIPVNLSLPFTHSRLACLRLQRHKRDEPSHSFLYQSTKLFSSLIKFVV